MDFFICITRPQTSYKWPPTLKTLKNPELLVYFLDAILEDIYFFCWFGMGVFKGFSSLFFLLTNLLLKSVLDTHKSLNQNIFTAKRVIWNPKTKIFRTRASASFIGNDCKVLRRRFLPPSNEKSEYEFNPITDICGLHIYLTRPWK